MSRKKKSKAKKKHEEKDVAYLMELQKKKDAAAGRKERSDGSTDGFRLGAKTGGSPSRGWPSGSTLLRPLVEKWLGFHLTH